MSSAFRWLSAVSLAVATASAELPTQPAGRFVESIGVNTHFNYPNTPYGTAYERVKRRLLDSGIRHIRDSNNERLGELGKLGIRVTLLVDETKPVAHNVEVIRKARVAGALVAAVEGPNEPDLFWERFKRSYNGQGHEQGAQGIIAGAIAFQKDFYTAIKEDPATRDLTVIGPSLGKTYSYETKSPFGQGALADFVDWGNFHPYAGGNPFSHPFPYAGIERYIWHGGHPGGNMDDRYNYVFDVYAPPFAPKPMAATEAGYSTYLDGPSEAAHAKYMPRLFCEYFRKGIQRTYSYEFLDEWNKPEEREANFGLLRFDQSPKPAYHAIRRLIRLVEDPSAPETFKSAPLPATLEVKPAWDFKRTEYVHHVALQQSDGTFVLLIWHEIAVDDVNHKPWRRVPLAPPMPAVLKFGKPAKKVEVFIPNDDESAVETYENTGEVTLGVPDRVMVVKLRF